MRTTGVSGHEFPDQPPKQIDTLQAINQLKNLGLDVGGSLEQTQEFKVDYNINKNMQLEGIYELMDKDDSGEDSGSNSIGVDFKWFLEFE